MKLSKKMLLSGAMLIFFVLLTVSCGDEKSPVAPAIDYRPPLIEWIVPASGADLVGVTRLAFTILDDASGIDRFAVYRNGFAPDEWRMAASDDSLYSVDWDTEDVPDDIYMLEIRAWDETGNLGISPSLRVNVRNNQDPREDHTPPDLWWAAPVPGSTLSGETTLQIKFYDESGVDSVRLLKNGAVVTTLFCTTEQDEQDGQDLTCCHTPSCDSNSNDLSGRRGRLPAHSLDGDSLTFLWDTSADPDGVYVWEARAFDAAGNMGLSPSLLVKVRNSQDPPPDDRTPPVMSWVSPLPNSEITGSTELLFQVLDNVGVDSVRIYLNGSSPVEFKLDGHDEIYYALDWETTADPDGVYVLELRAWDTSGNMGSGTSLVVNVLNNPTEPTDQIEPDVYWTAPNAGSTLQDTVRLQFRVLDEGVIDYIRLYKNGATSDEYRLPGNETGDYDFLWDTRTDSDGVYVWEARAWDCAGNVGLSPSLLLRVRNNEEPPPEDRTPPVISWLSPEPGSEVLGVVDLCFDVLDNIAVDSVKVYINGPSSEVFSLQGHQEINYFLRWSSIDFVDGLYYLEVRAWDPSRNLGLGEPISLTVYNNRPRVIWVPDEFETIQDAIWGSENGDTIMVRAGEYQEQLQFFDKNVSLISESGPEETIIDGTDLWAIVWLGGGQDSNMVFRGFTLINPSVFQCYCFSISDMNATIENNIFSVPRAMIGYGIISGINAANIRNNLFIDLYGVGDMASSWGDFDNNMIVNAVHGYRNAQGHGQPIIPDYNLFWNVDQIQAGSPMGWGDHNIDNQEPVFEEDSFRLREGSPGIDQGRPDLLDPDGSRSDIGVYGGPYAY